MKIISPKCEHKFNVCFEDVKDTKNCYFGSANILKKAFIYCEKCGLIADEEYQRKLKNPFIIINQNYEK